MSDLNLKSFLDVSIWKKFKMKGIHKSVLSNEQKMQLRDLDHYIKKHVSKSYKRYLYNGSFAKNKTGFSLYYHCHYKNCRVCWSLKLNLSTNKATLSCNGICEHLIDSLSEGWL